ncbi:hypothetical protein CF319_g7190 [Tilletia indica]|nr:hypothetical protein CF319_g7190 [Tilletia indica]
MGSLRGVSVDYHRHCSLEAESSEYSVAVIDAPGRAWSLQGLPASGQHRFDDIVSETSHFIKKDSSSPKSIVFVLISGSHGGSMIEATATMRWYQGWRKEIGGRLPVGCVETAVLTVAGRYRCHLCACNVIIEVKSVSRDRIGSNAKNVSATDIRPGDVCSASQKSERRTPTRPLPTTRYRH